jgi:sugar lactone lactonase YvrE
MTGNLASAASRLFSFHGATALLLGLSLAVGACGGGNDAKTDARDGATPDGASDVARDAGMDQGSADAEPDTAGGADADARVDTTPETDAMVCPAPPGDAGQTSPAVRADNIVFETGVTVSTVAGGAIAGTTDGPAASAAFSNPVSVALESAGSLLVCDWDSNLVRRVAADGTVTTLVRQGNFREPFGLAITSDGITYVGTDRNSSGQKSNLTGTVWRLEPSGAAVIVAENVGRPRGLAALPDGRLMLADYQNQRVRVLTPATGVVADVAGFKGCPGSADGTGTDARFGAPWGAATMPDGRVVLADYEARAIRIVGVDGAVTTFAGDGGNGSIDGPRAQARFVAPVAVAADAAGNVFVSDSGAHRIRRIGTDGVVITIAGDGTPGFKDGLGAEAQFFGQEGITVSADGKTVYVADGTGGAVQPHHRVRKIVIGP